MYRIKMATIGLYRRLPEIGSYQDGCRGPIPEGATSANTSSLRSALCLFFHRVFRIVVILSLTYAQKPRLVIGIVIDQMRADYLWRFSYKRGGGFVRLLEEGLVFWNCHYPYFPTYTAPGHTSIYTGTTPAYHGIVANTWYDRALHQNFYCVTDTTVRSVGTLTTAGRRSPRALWASTITDELRYASRFQSKVIGIALKDRSAILPGGRTASLALWFDIKVGRWITSSYYTDTLPSWVEDFNGRHYPDSLLKLPWRLSHGHICIDESPYEGKIREATTFPHRPASYEELLLTPAGNWLTLQLARQAIEAEKLGQRRGRTDFLAISLSSTDLAGHHFGTESCEIEEIYSALDKHLGDFLSYLTRKFRREDILLFLTADHGAAPTPEVLAEKGWHAGRFPTKDLTAEAQAYLRRMMHLSDTLNPIVATINQNFYLSDRLSPSQRREAMYLLKHWLLHQKNIIQAYTAEELAGSGSGPYSFEMLQAGFSPSRSGDVIAVYAPGWIEHEGYTVGTTHGSIWSYDTHVPLVWWGGGINNGAIYERVPITAIAPTLAFILRTPIPSAAFTPPLIEVLRQWKQPRHEVLPEGGQ
ncbi:MAG: alkaline phosphatase family protein [Bacteroidia bacterium]|nr:alkaline phosphatase family protein [Bacteroidia bacterium]MDW8417688.1 alkaline phosphatase family protein [Bacteroidia bacterium]